MKPKFWYKIKIYIPNFLYTFLLNLYYKTLSFYFIGDNVYCPCCNMHFRQFFNDGKYGGCPGCGSSARHRLVVLYLERETNFFG